MLSLRRLVIRNLRGMLQADVEFHDNRQVICLVGPNGAGKSSLITTLAHALFQLADESVVNNGDDAYAGRVLLKGEIGGHGNACGIRSEWSFAGRELPHVAFLRRSDADLDAPTGRILRDLDVPTEIPSYVGWFEQPVHRDEPMGKEVLLFRPATRYEHTSCDPVSQHEQPPLDFDALDDRPFLPVRSFSNLGELESLMPSIRKSDDFWQRHWFDKVSDVLSVLRGQLTEKVPRHAEHGRPIRYGPFDDLSLLSAAELDVLVTAGQLAAQQVTLGRKYDPLGLDVEPRGWALIDNVDLHLHPQWQERLVPLLCKLFPTINFVVTTHSPFILRSLPTNKSAVVRLPDGKLFLDDFSALNMDFILKVMFGVPSDWSQKIETQLTELREYSRDPDREQQDKAYNIYQELARKNPSLRAACDQAVVLSATPKFIKRINPAQTGPSAARVGHVEPEEQPREIDKGTDPGRKPR